MVLLMASWDRFHPAGLGADRSPVSRASEHPVPADGEGFVPPTWARQVVVVADAGFAANETLRLIAAKKYAYVFAMPHTQIY